MEFKVECNGFKEKLSNVQAAARYNKTGINANIKFDIDAASKSLKLVGTNEFVVISDICPITDVKGQDNAFLVDANKLGSITNPFNSGDHAFKLDNNTNLLIDTPHPKYNLRVTSADQFILPDTSEEKTVNFSISAGKLLEIFKKTEPFAASSKEWRHFLIGVNFDISKEKIVAVATDTHKLAYTKLDAQLDSQELSVIIPINAVQALQTVLNSHTNEAQVMIALNSNFATFNVGTVEIISQLISAKFPDYNRVLPKNQPTGVLKIQRQLLLDSIKPAIPIVGSSGMLIINLSNEEIAIQASNNDSESFNDEFNIDENCKFDGSPLKIGFNLNLIQTALETLQSDAVELEFYGDASGTKITDGSGDEKNIYIIMPMRI